MKNQLLRVGLLVCCLTATFSLPTLAQSVSPQNASINPQSSTQNLQVVAGERLVLQLDTPLNTRSTRQGDRAYFQTADEVVSAGQVVIPKGTEVRATVTKVKRSGRVSGKAELSLHFDEFRLADGTVLPFEASIVRAGYTRIMNSKEGDPKLRGEPGRGPNPMIVGQGGLQGALIGATIGGGKGAIYGGAAGAAIGLASVLFERGPELDLPRDILFELRLDANVDVPIAASRRAAQLAAARSVVPGGSSPNGSTSTGSETVPDFSRDRETDDASSTEVATTKTSGPLPSSAPGGNPIDTSSQTQDSPDDFKLKVDVQLVTVDTVVRDRNGRPLESLRKEDFRIFENGNEQTIQTFSRDEYPLAVALVVDRSGSVAPYMRELREAAYKALSQLKRGDQVCLFTFASEVQRLEDLTADRQRIADRIASIEAGGGTNIIDGLFDATYYLGAVARDRRRIVILISDNEATTRPRTSEGQVIRMATEMEAAIYSIKTVGEGVPMTMRLPNWAGGLLRGGSVGKITKETGGEIIDVASVGSLDAAMATVINRIKLRYTLGYTSSNPTKDGTFRKIEVRLTDPHGRQDSDYQISSRRGYYSNEHAVYRAASASPSAVEGSKH